MDFQIQNEILVNLKFDLENLKEIADFNKHSLLSEKLKDLATIRDHFQTAGLHESSSKVEIEVKALAT